MNREQAENILEAYINMECGGGDNKARQSLREVILDAMTEYRSKPTTWPGITIPSDGIPKVTYTGGERVRYDGEIVELGKCIKAQATCPDYTPKVTWTGVDPTLNSNTVSTVDGMAMAVGYQDGVVKVVDK